jgi:hypothetical protein
MNSSIMAINSVCDVSTIFAGGGPTAGATVIVGTKQLIPSPFLSLSLEKYKVGELTIGGIHKLSINGTVVGSSFGEVVTTGANGVTGLKDILEIGQYKECVKVEIGCSGNKIVDGYGRVTGISIPEGNNPTWVNMAQYTIEIDLYTNAALSNDRPALPGAITASGTLLDDLMLKSLSESFSIAINEDSFHWAGELDCTGSPMAYEVGNKHLKLNFSISAAGIRTLECEGGNPSGTRKYGLEAAEAYIKGRIDKLKIMDISDVYSSPPTGEIVGALAEYAGGSAFLDYRTLEVNPLEDSISINGEIIYRPSGCMNTNSLVTLNIEENVDAEGATINVTGNIQGLIDIAYDNVIKLDPNNITTNDQCTKPTTKIANAEDTLNDIDISAEAWALCYYNKQYIEDSCSLSSSNDPCVSSSPAPSTTPDFCSLRLVSRQISRNLPAGEINFTFSFSNKANCNILGAKKVDVEVTHDIPHDNIVEVLIPGRGLAGVITQNLCCKSIEKYDASINITLNRNNCNNTISNTTLAELRTCAENILKNKLDQSVIDCWFITNHQETDGNNSYRLNKTYVKPSC